MSVIKKNLRKIVPDILRVKYSVRRMKNKLPKDIAAIIEGLSKNDVVLDCGAHVGFSSLLFAKHAGQIIGFEPDPIIFETNLQNTRFARNVFTINAAVSCDPHDKILYRHRKFKDDPIAFSQASSLMEEKPNVDEASGVKVRSVQLDQFVRMIGNVKVLKIDIEGYEVQLLESMIESGALTNIDHIFVELHDDKFPELFDKTEALKKSIYGHGLEQKFHYDWI